MAGGGRGEEEANRPRCLSAERARAVCMIYIRTLAHRGLKDVRPAEKRSADKPTRPAPEKPHMGFGGLAFLFFWWGVGRRFVFFQGVDARECFGELFDGDPIFFAAGEAIGFLKSGTAMACMHEVRMAFVAAAVRSLV